MRVAIVGAGVAGLSAALVAAREHDVIVYESQAYPGGKVRSEHLDGYTFEWGPNGFLSGAKELQSLVDELGLRDEVVEANPAAAKRYIYWDGKLHALPQKPQQALATTLLSPLGKVRALRELFLKPDTSPREGESIDAFFSRHFGAEVAQRIVAPALLGMSAGDARSTSVDAAFPKLREFERSTGSVLKGVMRNRPAQRTALLSFGEAGMQRFAQAAAQRLGERLRLATPVLRIDRDDASWRIEHQGGSDRVDAVLITVPADAAAAILASFDSELAHVLSAIRYSPMRVAGIAYRREDVPVALDGFGFLAARDQGVRILGALYSSTMFPQQAPDDVAYLRIFMGGVTDPGIVDLSEEEARAIVAKDLRTTLGITASPLVYHELLWRKAIPQYDLDHPGRIRTIEARLTRYPRLGLAGNAYRGLGVGDTASEATQRVRAILGAAQEHLRLQ